METWREVPGREGYIVSDQGRAAKLMSLTPSTIKYVQFNTPAGPNGKRRKDYLHHWVLWAFRGPKPEEGAVARHLNDDPADNRLENLEWGSRGQNQHDMFRNGIKAHKTHCKHGHPLEGENVAPGRRCRTCQRARAKAQRARMKAAV